jgi:hypothetical protein
VTSDARIVASGNALDRARSNIADREQALAKRFKQLTVSHEAMGATELALDRQHRDQAGVILLACAIAVLVYGLITAPSPATTRHVSGPPNGLPCSASGGRGLTRSRF